jgi:hypothetical protein
VAFAPLSSCPPEGPQKRNNTKPRLGSKASLVPGPIDPWHAGDDQEPIMTVLTGPISLQPLTAKVAA